MKNRKLYMLLFILGFAFILLGTSYAFFSYNKTGTKHVMITGDISMDFNDGTDSINLIGIFPETKEEARSRDDNYITFTINGTNTSNKDIYYEVDLIDGDDETGLTRFNDRDLRFDLVEVNGSTENIIIDSVNFNIINNSKIWVETIDSGTTSYNKTYKLRMWLDEKVSISDTDQNASYSASTYKNHYASVKVKVVGDFVEKRLYNVMGTFPTIITDLKDNIIEVHFLDEKEDIIDSRYNAASIKADITNTSHSIGTAKLKSMTDYGRVLCWLEPIPNTENYKLYVGSDGLTYLSDGNSLFNEWSNLVTIDMQNVRTNFITDMRNMFRHCINLTSLNTSNFDTRNVTHMGSMFNGCSSLASLDISHFDTSKVTSMNYMFNSCSNLINFNLSNFDTSNVIDMQEMFNGCSKLKSLDLSNIDTSNVTNMFRMFNGCSSLTNLDVSHFDTRSVTTMQLMFNGCSSLTSLDVSHFDTTNVTTMASMFNSCSSLTSLDVSHFDTSNVNVMQQMFNGCSSLTNLDLSNFNTSNVTNMQLMFYNCSSLTNLNLSSFNTRNVTNMCAMFDNCSKLTSLDLNSLDTSNVTDMSRMFRNCMNLTNLNLNNFDTSKVTTMQQMFSGCSNLTSLNLNSFNTSSVTTMLEMFRNCSKLKTIYVGNNWNMASVTSSLNMFANCSSIIGGNGTTYDSSHIDARYAHVDEPGNPGYLTLKTS